MQMESQARFESLFDLKWPLLFIWTTGNKNDRAWPQMTTQDPEWFHAPRANWIILSQLGYFMTSLKLTFCWRYDLYMTGKFNRRQLQMTPYDLIWYESHDIISSNDLKPNQIMGNRKLCWCRKVLLRKFVTTTGMWTASRSRTVIRALQEKRWIFNSVENCSRLPMDWFQWIWAGITSTGSCFTFIAVKELESKPTFEKIKALESKKSNR